MPKNNKHHIALINSSFVVFYIVFSVLLGWILSDVFPNEIQTKVAVISTVYALSFFLFTYVLRQFYNAKHVLITLVSYFFISAIATFMSAIIGPLTEGSVPTFRVLFFGPELIAGSTPSYIYATVIVFYGAVNFNISLFLATITESLYERIARKLPKELQKQFSSLDHTIDKNAIKLSDTYFVSDELKGLAVAAVLLALYSALFIYLFLL